MRKLIRIRQKPEVVGEKVETLAQYPSQAHTIFFHLLRNQEPGAVPGPHSPGAKSIEFPRRATEGGRISEREEYGSAPSRGQPEIKKREQTHLTEWPEAEGL